MSAAGYRPWPHARVKFQTDMGFALTALFLILTFLSPAELMPSIGAYRPVLILVIFGIAGSILSVLSSQRSVLITPVFLMGAFTALVLLSLPLHGSPGGIVYAATTFLPAGIGFFLIVATVDSLRRLRILALIFVLLAFYYTLRGVGAYHFGIDQEQFAMVQTVETGDELNPRRSFLRTRGSGFLADPNDLAQNYLICLPFLGLLWKKRRLAGNLLLVILPGIILLYSLFLTGSRGALVGLFVIFALALRSKMGFLGPIASAGFTAFLFAIVGFGGGRAVSASGGTGGGRLELWSEALGLFIGAPIRGVGYDSITDYMHYTAHNSFLLCVTELGLTGYFFWLALLVTTILGLRQVRARKGDDPETEGLRKMAGSVTIALYTFLATGWFLSRTYTVTLYILLGMGVATFLVAQNSVQVEAPLRPAPWVKNTVVTMFSSLLLIYVMVRLRWV